jgi:hypothetical protein
MRATKFEVKLFLCHKVLIYIPIPILIIILNQSLLYEKERVELISGIRITLY